MGRVDLRLSIGTNSGVKREFSTIGGGNLKRKEVFKRSGTQKKDSTANSTVE